MSRLIDADTLKKAINDNGCRHSHYFDIFDVIDNASTVEQPTGEWLMPKQDDGMSDPLYYQVRCSECGFDLDPQQWDLELHQYGADNYCPKCGAKMKGGEGE